MTAATALRSRPLALLTHTRGSAHPGARPSAHPGAPRAARASAAALLVLARWITPDLPLYGDDHDRGDFAP
jgi:hypothetical protein